MQVHEVRMGTMSCFTEDDACCWLRLFEIMVILAIIDIVVIFSLEIQK